MTTDKWLRVATQFLLSKGIATARLDALVMLEDAMQINRAQLLAEPDMPMRDGIVHKLQELLSRRSKHEPLSYIRGRSEFYGRNYVIRPGVLTPRPESETMIDLLKDLYQDRTARQVQASTTQTDLKKLWFADVGAGSGCLGITATLELENTWCDLLEIDSHAQKVAKTNVDLMTTRANVVQSDLIQNAAHDYDVLLCNLPYVPDEYEINRAASFEPSIALYGGPDGLELYRKLFIQVMDLKHRPLYILSEALPQSHAELKTIAMTTGYRELVRRDFIQVFERIIV